MKEKKRTKVETEAIHTEKKKKKNCWPVKQLPSEQPPYLEEELPAPPPAPPFDQLPPLPASSFSYSHALFAPVTTVLQSE